MASSITWPDPRVWFQSLYQFNQYFRDCWVAEQAASIPGGARVLDVGSGSCPYRNLFAHCEYKTHDFVQLNPEQLLGQTGYGNIDFISDILSIPVPPASFDFILCTEVLEHVSQPIKVIEEFSRILRPGGKLLLTAPLGSGLHQEPYHFYGGYTPHWYKKFLTDSNFEQIVIKANGGFFKHYAQEGLRYLLLTAPWRGVWQFTLFPFSLLSFPWLAILCPILCHFLDRFDLEQKFTVGYFVTAICSN